MEKYIEEEKLSEYDVIYLHKVNKNIGKVYKLEECRQLHYQQILQIYSRKYLKLHNLLDLSTLEYDALNINLWDQKMPFNET